MTTLHILYGSAWPKALERLFSPGDAILLAGSSVALAVNPHGPMQHFLQRVGTGIRCLALDDAVQARGLGKHWPTSITRISDTEWVAMVCQHAKSLSWS